jgi:hypothetical protein
MTPEQEDLLERMSTFLDTLTGTLGKRNGDSDPKGAPEPKNEDASPKGAAQRVAKTVLESERAG